MIQQPTDPVPIQSIALHPGEVLTQAALYLTDTHEAGEHLLPTEIHHAVLHAAVELCGCPGLLATRTARVAVETLDAHIHRMPAYAAAPDPVGALVRAVSTWSVVREIRAAALATHPQEAQP